MPAGLLALAALLGLAPPLAAAPRCPADRPPAHCRVAGLIEGLPHDVSIALLGGRTELAVDDSLIFEVKGAFAGETLWVGFVSAEGTVQRLVARAETDRAGAVRRFGDGRPGNGGYTVREPVGPEMLVALRIPGAPSELADAPAEPVEAFAARLARIAKLRPGMAGGYVFFTTRPRS